MEECAFIIFSLLFTFRPGSTRLRITRFLTILFM